MGREDGHDPGIRSRHFERAHIPIFGEPSDPVSFCSVNHMVPSCLAVIP